MNLEKRIMEKVDDIKTGMRLISMSGNNEFTQRDEAWFDVGVKCVINTLKELGQLNDFIKGIDISELTEGLVCPKCGKTMKNTEVLTSMPPQYKYECECGQVEVKRSFYF